MSIIDPLEGLETRPLETQVGILANEVRNQRNMLVETRNALAGVQKALWYLVASIIVGVIVFVATTTLRSPNPPTTPAQPAVTTR